MWGHDVGSNYNNLTLLRADGSDRLPFVPRKIRIEYADAIYHVMSRGDRREAIFPTDVDRQDFLKTLAEACQKTGFQVHAFF